jgi:hypothetical protein
MIGVQAVEAFRRCIAPAVITAGIGAMSPVQLGCGVNLYGYLYGRRLASVLIAFLAAASVVRFLLGRAGRAG